MCVFGDVGYLIEIDENAIKQKEEVEIIPLAVWLFGYEVIE